MSYDKETATSCTSRNKCLDGLRGYAALAVVVFHSILMLNGSLVTQALFVPIYQIKENYLILSKLLLLVFNGYTAVYIFFVLSGMVLFQSLLRTENQNIPVVKFSLKRIIRIYLPLIPCLITFYLVFNALHYFLPTLYPHIKFHPFLQNCFLYKISIHGASWTLQAEILIIPVILLSYYLYKQFGIKVLLFLTALSILALDNAVNINFYSANTWLYYFYLGFLCAVLQGNNQLNRNKIGWALPFFLMIFARGFFNHSSITANLVQGISIALLVLYLTSNAEDRFSSFLKLPCSQYLGKISFSLYLWNVMVLNLFLPLNRFTLVHNHSLQFGLLIAFFTLIITWPLAHYSEKLIEQPAIKLGKILSTYTLFRSFTLLSNKQKALLR